MSTCQRCGGNGTTKCPECEGYGRLCQIKLVGFWTFKCSNCNESGSVDCPYCNGIGKINYEIFTV